MREREGERESRKSVKERWISREKKRGEEEVRCGISQRTVKKFKGVNRKRYLSGYLLIVLP